jgi:hypothetical protein
MNGMHHRFDDDLRRWAIVGVCWFVSSSFALISTAASGAKRTIYARRGAAGCTGCHDDARRQNDDEARRPSQISKCSAISPCQSVPMRRFSARQKARAFAVEGKVMDMI